jgi:hypothetical protein
MVPLIFRIMVEQDEAHILLGLILILFLAVMLAARHFLGRLVLSSIQLRFENNELELQVAKMQDELALKEQFNER